MRKIALLIVVAAAVCAATSTSATATAPQSVTINVNRDAAGDFWSASGAFSDAGTLADTPQQFTRAGTYHIFRTYSSGAGTFDTRGDVKIVPTANDGVFAVTGCWAVVGGTGAYADLHGTGTISETFDAAAGTVVGNWEGLVHFD